MQCVSIWNIVGLNNSTSTRAPEMLPAGVIYFLTADQFFVHWLKSRFQLVLQVLPILLFGVAPLLSLVSLMDSPPSKGGGLRDHVEKNSKIN